MIGERKIIALQLVILIMLGFFAYNISEINSSEDNDNGSIKVIDSNGVTHYFESSPESVAITNTYAATVMRMLEINFSVVTGMSGDFQDSSLWPELQGKDIIQNSAHSEIDYEALFDTQPEVYIVFATNGMVDTDAIRDKLEPVGIRVLALDFYKYDSLRSEMSVLANLFDKQQQLSTILAEFDEIEQMVDQRISNLTTEQRPSVIMEHHASLTRDPVVLTGTSQWNDIISMAGGINVFEDEPGHTTHVDMEAILDANPDYLMFDGITFEIGYNSYDPEDKCPAHFDFIKTRPGFDEITAIQDNNLLVMAGEFAGPMMIHGLPTLAKILHPNLFEDVDTNLYLDEYFSKFHNTDRVGIFVCQP